jgi:predicted phosphodiesterase
MSNKRILCLSDMHVPYHHPDTFAFLAAVKKKYNPDRIVCLGDEVDHHAMSFHDSDPDLMSAGDELESAIRCLKSLYKLFPKMDLIDSNHGSMAYRKSKAHGIPRKYIKGYNEVLDAPKGWRWHMDLTITAPNGSDIYFHHGLSKDVMKVVNQRGVCVVQGHYHTEFRIGYSGNPNALLWGMNVGCSIDPQSYAFHYDRTNLPRPIIGHAIVLEGLPKLLPMVLKKNGRWNKVVP